MSKGQDTSRTETSIQPKQTINIADKIQIETFSQLFSNEFNLRMLYIIVDRRKKEMTAYFLRRSKVEKRCSSIVLSQKVSEALKLESSKSKRNWGQNFEIEIS